MLDKELSKVKVKRKMYERYLPLSSLEEKALSDGMSKYEVYCSNHIEGNSYSKEETIDLIDSGFTSVGKPFRDAIEIVNLYKVMNYAYNDFSKEITEDLILKMHLILTSGILDYEDSGVYKKRPNRIGDITTSSPEHTPIHMKKLLKWYKEQDKNTNNIIAIATEFKYRFLCIHPFFDGNGRMSRILFNLIIMQKGYVRIAINPNSREEYYRVLKLCNKFKSSKILYTFLCERLIESYDFVINLIEGENVNE